MQKAFETVPMNYRIWHLTLEALNVKLSDQDTKDEIQMPTKWLLLVLAYICFTAK